MRNTHFHLLTQVRGISSGGEGPISNEVLGETIKTCGNDGMKPTSSTDTVNFKLSLFPLCRWVNENTCCCCMLHNLKILIQLDDF